METTSYTVLEMYSSYNNINLSENGTLNNADLHEVKDLLVITYIVIGKIFTKDVDTAD